MVDDPGRVTWMPSEEPPNGLIWSDAILAEGEAARRSVEQQLSAIGVPGEVVISGPVAVPGVLTRGDLDLHLRVPTTKFAEVVALLRTRYRPASPEAWASTLAVFEVPGLRSTGLAVTPLDSEHDRRFQAAWTRLSSDAGLRAEYNAMKTTWVGTDGYEVRKSAFFDRLASPPDTGA